jgi:hypothetical protein
MSIKVLATNKLYYRKWIYKVECVVEARVYSLKYHWYKSFAELGPALKAFAKDIEFLEGQDIQTRVENRTYTIFCRDENLLKEIVTRLEKWIYAIYRPESEAEKQFLLEKGHTKILRDEYFKGTYRYRVYINNRLDFDNRHRFWEWLQKYDESLIYLNGSTKTWLSGTLPYLYSPFIYIADPSMLSMVYLYLGNNIKSTDEFILKDNINNISCQP